MLVQRATDYLESLPLPSWSAFSFTIWGLISIILGLFICFVPQKRGKIIYLYKTSSHFQAWNQGGRGSLLLQVCSDKCGNSLHYLWHIHLYPRSFQMVQPQIQVSTKQTCLWAQCLLEYGHHGLDLSGPHIDTSPVNWYTPQNSALPPGVLGLHTHQYLHIGMENTLSSHSEAQSNVRPKRKTVLQSTWPMMKLLQDVQQHLCCTYCRWVIHPSIEAIQNFFLPRMKWQTKIYQHYILISLLACS